ncbi:MAG: hypothetical protein AB2758_21020 [Candidatus Thiodiazotropha endolucinida]
MGNHHQQKQSALVDVFEHNGIIVIDYGPHGVVDLPRITEALRLHREISIDKRPVLLRCDDIIRADYDAQRFAVTNEVIAVTSAVAIVVKSFLARHLGNMFLRYHLHPYPTRLFENEIKAIDWLNSFKQQKEV